MINKFTKVTTILSILFIINFLTGCITHPCPPVLYFLTDVNVKTIDRVENQDGTIDFIQTDTIRNQLAFEVYPTVEIAAAEKKIHHSFMSVAYGNCDDGIAMNPIVPSKSKMYTNKDFYYDGGFVPAGENLLEDEVFKDFIDFPEYLYYNSFSTITFDEIPLKLFNDAYIFNFEWETSDGVILTDEVELYFR